jgi:Glucose-6-phosphate isomerase
VIASKRKALAAKAPPRHSAVIGSVDLAVARRLDAIDAAHLPRRIWERDPAVWKDDPDTPEIRDRLGWLTVGKAMAQQARALAAFADQVRAEFGRVVLCGMGGSSLAPEVLWRTFGAAPGYPALHVLDSTDPRAVRQAEAGRRPGEDRCSSSRASQARPRKATASSATSGSAPAGAARSSWRSPIRARRSSGSPASEASGARLPIRPTSAAGIRRSRSSGWCRRR